METFIWGSLNPSILLTPEIQICVSRILSWEEHEFAKKCYLLLIPEIFYLNQPLIYIVSMIHFNPDFSEMYRKFAYAFIAFSQKVFRSAYRTTYNATMKFM